MGKSMKIQRILSKIFNQVKAEHLDHTWWFLGAICLKLVVWTPLLPIRQSSLLLTPTDGFVKLKPIYFKIFSIQSEPRPAIITLSDTSSGFFSAGGRCRLVLRFNLWKRVFTFSLLLGGSKDCGEREGRQAERIRWYKFDILLIPVEFVFVHILNYICKMHQPSVG